MNAAEIEAGALAEAEEAGAQLARVELLKREFGLCMALGRKLRAAIEAEEALGLDAAAGFYDEMLWANQSALRAIVRELGRVAK